jgi:predicted N-acetyltransferase YhbS
MSAGVPRAHAQDVAVRLERPSDIAGIYAVHAASFPSVVEARLVDALRNAGRLTASFVAVDGEVVLEG